MKQNFLLALTCACVLIFSACKKDDKDDDKKDEESTDLTFTDSRDSKTYKYVKIGDQYWMAEDLDYQGGTYYCYDDNSSNCTSYSVLYDSLAANSACPSGWHLPTDAEFRTLEKTIGFSDADTMATGSRGDGSSLKAGGSTGFNVSLYPGYAASGGNYLGKDGYVYYWATKTYYRRFTTTDNMISRPSGGDGTAGSRRYCVRCLKN